MQRSAEEHDVPVDAASLRQTRDGLVDDGLIDRSRDVLLLRALVQQRLDIGLREHAAAARYGIDAFVLQSQFVELFHGDVQQRRHLVDEGARAAGAAAVHAFVHAAPEEDDLRVFPAELRDDVRLGFQHFHDLARREDLLHERQAGRLGEAEPRAAGDRSRERLSLQEALGFLRQFHGLLPHLGKVPFIFLKQDLPVFNDDDLGRRGPDVQAHEQSRVFTAIMF